MGRNKQINMLYLFIPRPSSPRTMSQTPYQPPSSTANPATAATTPSTTTTPTTPAYPYGAYHPSAYATGAYGYGAYQTGVTGYGWPYPYSYLQQHNQAAAAAAAAAAASAATHFSRPTGVLPPPTTAMTGLTGTTTQYHPGISSTTTPSQTALSHRTPTFSAYTPSYSRDTYTGRGGKRQSNLRGLFTKECTVLVILFIFSPVLRSHLVRSLMYGFGDDRNPANDTVNVMEEILIEYITDVVRTPQFCLRFEF